jgi:hypothetical protein
LRSRSSTPAPVALAAWIILVATAASAVVRVEVEGTTAPDLRITASNAGDEPADEVVPEVLYQHRSWTGAAVRLGPDERHEWGFALPAPPGPGTFPAIVRVRYRDPLGRRGAVPLVLALSTPGVPMSVIEARLETGTVRGEGHGTFVLTNSGVQPIAGRAVFVLPGGITTEPESMPAQVAPGGRTVVPLVVQAADLPPGRYPVYATFEYTRDGTPSVVVGSATIEVVAGAPAGRNLRLLVGAAALVTALLAVVLAGRAARRS